MADPLAAYTDANTYLDNSKVTFVDDDDALPEAEAAGRLVRAYLASVYPEHVMLWDSSGTPEPVPEIIKEITALLMASYRYARKYSAATNKPSEYAGLLEARAMNLLKQLQAGTLTLADVDYDDEGIPFGSADFWPNDTTLPSPLFEMGMGF